MIAEKKWHLPQGWLDYKLLDSGEGLKRERWGNRTLIRPEQTASWPQTSPEHWKEWDGFYHPSQKDRAKGRWEWRNPPKNDWQVCYRGTSFLLRANHNSPQVGIFPEQGSNWDWLQKMIIRDQERGIEQHWHYQRQPQRQSNLTPSSPRLLNLFGYTGAASVIAAQAGAAVSHVDASESAVSWASENARSQPQELSIRWIVDDVQKFLLREKKRGHCYEAIILDPPTFGRGSNNKIWKIKDHLTNLLQQCLDLLTPDRAFLMMSTYSSFLSKEKLATMLKPLLQKRGNYQMEICSLGLHGAQDQSLLPRGITTRIDFSA